MPGIYVDSVKEQLSLPFNPTPLHRLHTPLFNANFAPNFLYRLVAPQSAGPSTSSTAPPPALQGNGQDIFHLPPVKAVALLLDHLLWQRGHEDGCTLMSWTSSLLFALQYALYRHSKDGDDLSQIYLIILDTRAFPEGTFIQDMEVMRAFQGTDGRLQKFVEFRESEYYFGEYLTQGRLNIQGRCVCASVQQMIEFGLFDLQPALADESQWKWWPKRVLDFRQLFQSGKCVPATDGDVETAVDIARRCFGAQWVVPGSLMLLALQPRTRDDRVILRGFKERFTGSDVRRAGLDCMKIDTKRLPEVGQFKGLVELIQHSYALSDYQSLVDSVQVLKV
ncbi:hypothetical protein BDW59DRAFT_151364 [Aspergillus cavernicola]|uniref:Uncharacterized protein n=1 Tax=Aspergillus cavernicola TaxID=176166 RepID=A0ABR4HVQ8_9EURO